MLTLHVSDPVTDELLEKLPEIVRATREVEAESIVDYLLLKRFEHIAGIRVRLRESEHGDVKRYVDLLTKLELGQASQEDMSELSQLKRKLRDLYCSEIKIPDVLPLLMLRVCVWDTTFTKLFRVFLDLEHKISSLSVPEVFGLIWALARYHLHELAASMLRRAVRELKLCDIDVLRLAGLILFGLLDLTPRFLNMYTLKIHDVLSYFSWVIYTREPPLAKHQEFFIVFESCDRPYMISNAPYVSDQARISLTPNARIRRVARHVFLIEEEKYRVGVVCSMDGQHEIVTLLCDECVLKSRDIDTKVANLNQEVVLLNGDLLIAIGRVELKV